MTIFLILNGLGVIFLLYVLANFWKEGRRPVDKARKYERKLRRWDWDDVAVVTHPISTCAQGGLSVISFQTRRRAHRADVNHPEAAARELIEMPLKRIPTNGESAQVGEYDSPGEVQEGRRC
jgi:hypothetical protein